MASIGVRRMASQGILRPAAHPSEVVARLGAVQAQDYLGALWAVGLRTAGASEATVEQALAERTIVRTWPMRGTIHFVAPADVRWMLELLTPRVVQNSRSRRAGLGLDAATLAASAEVVAGALQGNRQLTRNTLYGLLQKAGIASDGQRGLHILGYLAHERLICFGAREGKQPTFALLDEWAPDAKSLPRDEALARLALRYFSGHGPATLQDFIWWTGLTAQDARAGLAVVARELRCEQIDGQEYYADPAAEDGAESGRAWLLPPFDEFLVGYRDRSASLDPHYRFNVVPGGNGIFFPIIVIDGRVLGTWKRTFKGKHGLEFAASPFESLSEPQQRAVAAAAERYSQFVGKTLAEA